MNKINLKKAIVFLIILLANLPVMGQKINVLIWDEQQPTQKPTYENFLGNEIAARLKTNKNNLEIRSVKLDDPEQGLTPENLNWAKVLIWWGHARQGEISSETVKRKLMKRIRTGKLHLIALHSAHWATPFMECMNERTMQDARRLFPQPKGGRTVEFEFVPMPFKGAPMKGSAITPSFLALKRGKDLAKVVTTLPNCCFPSYRPDGKPSTMTVTLPDHPIAKGLPKTFKLSSTEMYNEPFHVPRPDEVIFKEEFSQGEWFRSGMTWKVGKGKVFYFRPGHETYPVFKDPNVIKIIENACHWLGSQKGK